MANSTCQEPAPPVDERPRRVAELTTSRWRDVPDWHEPFDLQAPLAAATPATPARALAGQPGPTKRSRQPGRTLQSAYSFVGGFLIGISIALPVLAVEGDEGGGALVLAGSLTLAVTGIGMHVRGAKRNGDG